MSNEADRVRRFELSTDERLSGLEERRDNGAIAKNAAAMKETIEHWNREYTALEIRITAMENNIVNFLRIVRDLQDSNTLAIQRARGTGPTV